MPWDLSCTDWERRLRSGRSLVPDLPLDLVAGNRAVAVFNKLRLADVPGTPSMEEAAGDWFRDIVRALFGSVDPVSHQRMIRELLLLIAKKNSKTTNGALLMLTALLLNQRPMANFIMTAPVQDVTDLAFSAASGAIALDYVLVKKLHVREHLKTIVHRETKATLEIMTFDPAVLTGQKVSGGVLIDELHVIAKMSKAASAIRQLRGGMLPFPESFMAFITTQSEEAPSGVFGAELRKARAIRDGKQVGAMLPVLYEFPKSIQADRESWKNPLLWHMVNPNAGRSITIDRLVEEFNTASETGLEELIAWASQHLNVETGVAILAGAWAGATYWERQGAKKVTLDYIIERSEVITVGIDGGGLDDLLGFGAIGRDRETQQWLLWTHAWAHPIVLERRKSEAPKFLEFAADGDLTMVQNIGDDVSQVADVVERLEKSGKMDKIGVDQAGIGAIVDAIVAKGIKIERIVAIPQGWKMMGAIKTTERKLAGGQILHGAQRLMEYCVGNAKVEPRGNAILITKQAAGSAKIDPLAATFNAASLMSLNPKAPGAQYQSFVLG